MNKLLLLLSFFTFSAIHAQNQYPYPFFPKDQHCYFGGFPEFYKDFHKILVEKNLKPCENKSEYFTAFAVIKPDGTARLIESRTSQNNKCSYELTKEVMKYMDKWIPAKIDGKDTTTIAQLQIYMDDLFDKYTEGYHLGNTIKPSSFNIQEFRKEVLKRVDFSDFTVTRGKKPLKIVAFFVINEEGKIEDLKITTGSGLQQFDDMILTAIKRSLNSHKWEPAKMHDMPIKSRFYIPMSVNGDD